MGGECPSYIGRIPYRTLGIDVYVDGYGETFWYAVSRDYSRDPICGVSCPLNSDTVGQINITGTTPANGVIAVIMSPGQAINNQNRSAAGLLAPANYFEGANADGATPFETRLVNDTVSDFNDMIYPVTVDHVMNVVTKRVAKEVVISLENYRNANGYLPRANPYTDNSGNCNSTLTQGRLPLNPATCPYLGITILGIPITLPMASWGSLLPSWYSANEWNKVTHYAVSDGCSAELNSLGLIATRTSACQSLDLGILGALLGGSPETPITVPYTSTTTNVLTAVLVSGRSVGTQVHPCANQINCFRDDLTDTENSDGDKTFALPQRYPTTNDKLAAICPNGSACQIALCPGTTGACPFAP